MGGKHQGTAECPERERGQRLGKDETTYEVFGRGKASAYVVMDFDLTLSSIHVWNWLSHSGKVTPDRIPRELAVDDIYGGAERLKELETFFQHLAANSVQVIILTNNYREVVAKCLKESRLDRYKMLKLLGD